MAQIKKTFSLRPDQVKPLAKNRGGCIATDMITVQGHKVGYMLREEPSNTLDSGWQFMSGLESQDYMDNAANHAIYDVNTIANYDPEIIPFLDAPAGSAFERQGTSGQFTQIQGDSWEPAKMDAAPAKKWPPPGFPLVEGDHALTATWSIQLPELFARRVEGGSLVLWRSGLTLWLTAWNNDHGEFQDKRLAWIKKTASKTRMAEHESQDNYVTRYSYRLREENEAGSVESIGAVVIDDSGHLQIAAYFDDLMDEIKARALVDSVSRRRST